MTKITKKILYRPFFKKKVEQEKKKAALEHEFQSGFLKITLFELAITILCHDNS